MAIQIDSSLTIIILFSWAAIWAILEVAFYMCGDKEKDTFLKRQILPFTNHWLTIDLPSTHHWLAIDLPLTYNRLTFYNSGIVLQAFPKHGVPTGDKSDSN